MSREDTAPSPTRCPQTGTSCQALLQLQWSVAAQHQHSLRHSLEQLVHSSEAALGLVSTGPLPAKAAAVPTIAKGSNHNYS